MCEMKSKNILITYQKSKLNMGSAPSHKKVRVSVPRWATEHDKFRKNKYPNCAGTFPECPKEIKADVVEGECKNCPLYKNW